MNREVKFNSRGFCSIKYDRAQAMVEYIIIFPVVLMLLFGALQFALIYQAKTTLNYATFEAVRAAAVNNGRRDAVNEAFARGMSPLYTHKAEGLDAPAAVHEARNKVLAEVNSGEFVCMERISPGAKEFSSYSVPQRELNNADAIPVDNLVYRSDIPTGGSPLSIHDASLFKLKVTYCYPLYVPFLNRIIPGWFTGGTGRDTGAGQEITYVKHDLDIGAFKDNCIANQRIPIISSAIMRMHSPVVNDAGYSAIGMCE